MFPLQLVFEVALEEDWVGMLKSQVPEASASGSTDPMVVKLLQQGDI